VQIDTTPPDQWFLDNNYNVFVKFEVRQPYFGYILTDSRVKVISSDWGHLGLFGVDPGYNAAVDTHLKALLARKPTKQPMRATASA
jgi:hypothetical protein